MCSSFCRSALIVGLAAVVFKDFVAVLALVELMASAATSVHVAFGSLTAQSAGSAWHEVGYIGLGPRIALREGFILSPSRQGV